MTFRYTPILPSRQSQSSYPVQDKSREYGGKLTEMNLQLVNNIDSIHRRSDWKRRGGNRSLSRDSRKITNNNAYVSNKRRQYQTDNQSFSSSRASTSFLNGPILSINQKSTIKYQNKQWDSGEKKYNSNQYGVKQNSDQKYMMRMFQHKSDYINGKLSSYKKQEISQSPQRNQSNYHRQSSSNSAPYFKNSSSKVQQYDQTFKTNFQQPNKKDHKYIQPSEQDHFQQFSQSYSSPFYNIQSPFNLTPPASNSQIPNTQTTNTRNITINTANIGPPASNIFLNRLQSMLQNTLAAQDGRLFIFLLIGVGVLLVLFQIIR